jgi:hypothetical protein
MKKLILAAALVAPFAVPALAQVSDVSGGAGASGAVYSSQAPREFTARNLIETRQSSQAPVRADRNTVPASSAVGGN